METNLLVESCKTFIVQRFGIALDNKVIPVGSIGTIPYIGEGEVYIEWECPEKKKIKTRVTYDEFWDLLKYKYMVDITK